MSTFDKSVDTQQPVLTSFKTIFFALIEKISLGRSQIDNLRAPVSIFFLYGALLAIVSIRDTNSSTNHTAA